MCVVLTLYGKQDEHNVCGTAAVAVLSVILSSHLGGGHRHVNLLPVQRERANDPHGNRDVPTNDLAVRTEDALIVVALLNYATHDTTQRSRKNTQI